MSNRMDLIIFVAIVTLSLANWIATQIKEKRELEKINRRRREQGESVPTTEAGEGDRSGPGARPVPGTSIAESRQRRLRELRAQQSQRTREQVRVLTGQDAIPKPGSRPGGAVPRPTPGPGGPGPRRPLRPGRTARRTPTDPPPVPSAAQEQARLLLAAQDTPRHAPLPSEPALRAEGADEPTAGVPGVSVGRTDWRRAIVLSEILGKPVSLREAPPV